MTRALWLPLLVLAGCTPEEEKYIVVTVDARPAVHDVAMIRVTLSNEGSMRTEDLPLGAQVLPATFSISPEDRVGELGISIEAFDEDNQLVGRGSAQSAIATPTASVLLEPTDFVVNTDYAGDQKLSSSGAHGFQLAAAPDGTWTTVYSTQCTTPCNVFGRRFDAAARPVTSVAAAGTNGFPLSTRLTSSISRPTVAISGATTLTLWNSYNNPGYSIECRAFNGMGAATSAQVQIATDELAYLVSATVLPNGNFAIVWDGNQPNFVIRSAIVGPNCTPVAGSIRDVSANVAGSLPEWSHLATNGANILYTWKLSGSLRIRAANLDGALVGAAETELITKTATEQIEYARVAPLGTGFAIIVRWAQIVGTTGPGRLELYRTTNLGALMGPPTLISDRSGSDFDSSQAFGVARRPDGTLLVVWHSCLEKGDGSGCGVFGRLLRPDGTPDGAEFGLATTTANDQTGPSAVALPDGAFATAWTDASAAPPDTSGTAVRARIIYPPR